MGADEAIGFYDHLGYGVVLMLHWTRESSAADPKIARLQRGCLAGLTTSRATHGDLPQLFATLSRPDVALMKAAEREAPGCVAGMVMVKSL